MSLLKEAFRKIFEATFDWSKFPEKETDPGPMTSTDFSDPKQIGRTSAHKQAQARANQPSGQPQLGQQSSANNGDLDKFRRNIDMIQDEIGNQMDSDSDDHTDLVQLEDDLYDAIEEKFPTAADKIIKKVPNQKLISDYEFYVKDGKFYAYGMNTPSGGFVWDERSKTWK